MNDENNFNIENKFINYGTSKKKKKKLKILLILLFLLLLAVLGYLIYANKIAKQNNKRSNSNYEEYDPNYHLDEDSNNQSNNVTSNITSNISSNINITSNIINSNTNNKPSSNIAVSGVSLPSTTNINVGGSKTLNVSIKPSNATNKKVMWSSSNTNIVTVDNNGKITGKKVGTATITVTTRDGNKKATCKVTVTAEKISVTGIKLEPSTLTMGGKGTKAFLHTTITPSNATNKDVIWSSSNNKVVTVDQSGNLTGIDKGQATITATTKDGNKKATCLVTVSAPAVSSISITADSARIYIGEYIYPKITYYPSDATGKSVKWSSSNPSIATVRSDGRITGVSEGDVTITATTPNGKKESKIFYIRHNPASFKVILIRTTNANPKTGEIAGYKYTYDIRPLTESAHWAYQRDYIYYNNTTIKGSIISENANLYNPNIKRVTIYSTGGLGIQCVPEYDLR